MKRILLVPLTGSMIADYLEAWAEMITDSLSKAGISAEITIWPEIRQLVMECYDWSRRQYRSPCLLNWLSGYYRDLLDEHYVLGVGYIDAYDDGLNFVFGEASPSASTGIVYTRRLDPRFYGEQPDWNRYVERTGKELIHELGHLLGLGHCHNKGCVMSFSNSVYDVDGKTMYFCTECAGKLRRQVLNV